MLSQPAASTYALNHRQGDEQLRPGRGRRLKKSSRLMPKSLRLSHLIARPKHGAAYIGVETETQFGPEPSRPEPRAKTTIRPWRLAARPPRHDSRSAAAMPVPGRERSGSLILSHDRLASPCRAGDLRSSPASRRSRARVARGLTGGRGSGLLATSGHFQMFGKYWRMALGSLICLMY